MRDQQLLQNIKESLPELITLLERVNSHWEYEDRMYRFYYQSWKVYHIQNTTEEIVLLLSKLAVRSPPLHSQFMTIIVEGTNREFEMDHNRNWAYHTQPIIDAFLHAKYFLEMAVKYGKLYTEAPQLMHSGWAALLCLYGIR